MTVTHKSTEFGRKGLIIISDIDPNTTIKELCNQVIDSQDELKVDLRILREEDVFKLVIIYDPT